MRLLAAAARKAGVAAFVMVFLFSYAGPGSFASVPRTERIPRSAVNEPIRLMVQLQAAPLADDAPGRTADRTASLEAEQVAFRARLQQAGLEYREVSAHKTLFNGLTIRIRPGDLGRVAGLRGVRAVFVAQKTKAPRPQLASSVGMVGGHQAWAGDPAKAIPGVDGTGITVAVIDTGIDYLHPDLGGCLGPDCRVIGGRDFVGDEFDGSNEPVPDDDPMDVNGHGTHVAGIIGARAAGEDGVTGVAPGVKFLALKVFGAGGHTWDDIILQALEAAYEMGADVINMSIGSAFQWPQYPTAQAVQYLANRGIVVATSAGNSGEAGEFATGAPAVAPGNMAVASFENDFVRRRGFMLPDGTIIGYGVMEHSPDPPGTGESSEVVYAGLGRSDEEFLNPDGTSRVDGKVALISRGAITFREKTLNAMRHGAVQVVIFNSVNGFFRGTMGSTGEYLPTLSISRADGLRLKELAEAGSLRLTWTEKLHLLANDTAGLISDFSSWGPSPDLAVKPDLTAPGGSIYSTFPLAYGGYATLSGTSMAAPHVAGAAALILQARRAMVEQDHAPVKPTAVRTLLMNTAFPRTKGPGSEQYYPVHRQGAGMMDAWRAINARQRVLPEKIAFGAVKGGTTVVESFMIENLSAETQTFTFRALGDGDTTSVQVAAEPEALQVGARRTGRATLSLTVPEDLPQNAIFSGWVAVLNSDEEIVAHVPYLGYNGDYQAASALDPLPYGLPWLARLDEGWLMRSREIEIRPGCGCDAQWAWILFSLARQPQELRMEIWNADTGRKWGNTFTASYLGRSDGGIEVFVWNAETDKGRQVPAGTYVLQLKALRPLGDRFNPDHWDVWTSGRIRVVWD